MKNYSKYVKSRNWAILPDIGCKDHSVANAQASSYDCLTSVIISTLRCHLTQRELKVDGVRRTDIGMTKVILASKVTNLKSLHDKNIDLPTELDHPLRTSIHVLVQNSAPQAPESTLAGHVMQASIHQKIVSKNVLLSEMPLLDIYPNPKGPSGLVVPSTHPKGQLM